MAIYLKRRRTTIEEWSRTPLPRADAALIKMEFWPQRDEELDETGLPREERLLRDTPDGERMVIRKIKVDET